MKQAYSVAGFYFSLVSEKQVDSDFFFFLVFAVDFPQRCRTFPLGVDLSVDLAGREKTGEHRHNVSSLGYVHTPGHLV